jgi:hypothetical protein
MKGFTTYISDDAIEYLNYQLKDIAKHQHNIKNGILSSNSTPLHIDNLIVYKGTFSDYLKVVTLTSNHLITFHSYKDNSFMILKTNFNKAIGKLREELEKILDYENQIEINNDTKNDFSIIFLEGLATLETTNKLMNLY